MKLPGNFRSLASFGGTRFLSYGRFASDSSTSRLKFRHFFRECVSLIHMSARYRRDFMGDEAEDNVFRRKPDEID